MCPDYSNGLTMQTINFTRGVPANESFPIDEVIDAAVAALASINAARRCCKAWTVAGISAAARMARDVARRDARSRADRQRLPAADRVPLPAHDRAWRRGVHRVADVRPHDHDAAASSRQGRQHSARGGRSEHRRARARAHASGAEVLLPHPRFSESIGRDLLSREATEDRRAGRAAQLPPRRGRAVPAAALPRQGRDNDLRARARADAAYELSSPSSSRQACGQDLHDRASRRSSRSSPRSREDTYISPGYVAQGITVRSGAAVDCSVRRSSG